MMVGSSTKAITQILRGGTQGVYTAGMRVPGTGKGMIGDLPRVSTQSTPPGHQRPHQGHELDPH